MLLLRYTQQLNQEHVCEEYADDRQLLTVLIPLLLGGVVEPESLKIDQLQPVYPEGQMLARSSRAIDFQKLLEIIRLILDVLQQ